MKVEKHFGCTGITPYGFIFDKQGNRKQVSAPITRNGKKVKKHTKTQTGQIGRGVGFSGYKK